jgi:maltose alpha-D-glucosyltransferase/alpha-amylase
VIAYGDYSFHKVSVSAQMNQKNSLLEFVRNMIALRKKHPEIGLGNWKAQQSAGILMMEYHYQNKHLFTVHNFKAEKIKAEIPQQLKARYKFISLQDTNGTYDLEPYGFRWYELKER